MSKATSISKQLLHKLVLRLWTLYSSQLASSSSFSSNHWWFRISSTQHHRITSDLAPKKWPTLAPLPLISSHRKSKCSSSLQKHRRRAALAAAKEEFQTLADPSAWETDSHLELTTSNQWDQLSQQMNSLPVKTCTNSAVISVGALHKRKPVYPALSQPARRKTTLGRTRTTYATFATRVSLGLNPLSNLVAGTYSMHSVFAISSSTSGAPCASLSTSWPVLPASPPSTA